MEEPTLEERQVTALERLADALEAIESHLDNLTAGADPGILTRIDGSLQVLAEKAIVR